MTTLSRRLIVLIGITAILAGLMVTPALFAQEEAEETEEPGETITCSSDLIVMLYIAERYFNFGSVHETMMADDEEALDLTRIDRGQFTPAFDAITTDEDLFLDETAVTDVADLMAMDEATLTDQLAGEMDTTTLTQLTPIVVQDEPAECATLRSELTRFFLAVAVHDLTAPDEMEATPAPDVETPEETEVSTPTESVEEMAPTTEPTVEPTAEEATGDTDAMTFNFTAPMSGPQEVPGPGDADATGTANVSINQQTNEVCWDITVMNAMLPATGAHIHVGAFGESGDVVVPLSEPDASGFASGCTTAEADIVAAIVANPVGYYVNIHTSDFPDGALRGQLG